MEKASYQGGNLGDFLWLTPLARYVPDLTIQMREGDKRAQSVSPIFDGLCDVEFVENPSPTKKTNDKIHVTQKILNAYGVFGRNSIPKICLKEEEIKNAKKILSNYKNPIAIINNNSGTNDPLNSRAKYVCPPHKNMQEICNHFIKNGRSVVQFGPTADYYDRDTFVPLDGAFIIRGLSVRELAACYHLIGQMISGDTGDYHLMLAVGGECITLIPHESLYFGYIYSDLLYGYVNDDWAGEEPRCTYINHELYKTIINERIFL